jgi:hypothetical protein
MMVLLTCIIDCKDWILIFIGFIITVIWTFFWAFVIYFLKPNVDIESIEFKAGDLRINVINKGKFNATNLNIEACGLLNGTFHFKLDKEEFIILPPKNRKDSNDDSHIRTFKSRNLTEEALQYSMTFMELINQFRNNQHCILRIRIHAYHEISGFGRAFEFKFRNLTDRFVKLK